MKILLAFILTLAAPVWAAAPSYPHVEDTSFVAPDGSATLEQSVVIDAPVAVLWQAYVDPKEFARWNAPFETVDLRVGGTIEASYDAKAKPGDPDNIRHRIVTYIPERLLALQNIQAPRGFPHPELFQRTVVLVRYQPLGRSLTRVTVDVTGWGRGPDDRRLYEFFRAGDASLLEKMRSIYGATSEAAPVEDSSYSAPDGERTIRQSIEIQAPAACVWRQFTDEAAIRAGGIAMAHVDLRVGGSLEEGFSAHPAPTETIRHHIVTFVPERLLVLRNEQTPPGLPGAALYPNIVQVISLDPLAGGVVRLTVSHTGYGGGAGYDSLYAFFRDHNPAFLIAAKKACEGGGKVVGAVGTE